MSQKTRIGPLKTTIDKLRYISIYGLTASRVPGIMTGDQEALYSVGILSDDDWEIEVFSAKVDVYWRFDLDHTQSSISFFTKSYKLEVIATLHVYGPDTSEEYTEHEFRKVIDNSFELEEEFLEDATLSNELAPTGVTIDLDRDIDKGRYTIEWHSQ